MIANINLMYLDYIANDVYGDTFELYDFVPKEIAVEIVEDLHKLSAQGELFDWEFKDLIKETIADKYKGKQLRGQTNPVFIVWQYIKGSVDQNDTLLWKYFHGQDISDIITNNVASGYHWLADTFIEPVTTIAKPLSKILWIIGTPIFAYYALKIISNFSKNRRISK